MKPSLQLRLSQQLTLTPQLQQSIRLLQLSTLELQTEIEQALSDNPLLERVDDPLDRAVRLASDGGMTQDTDWNAGFEGPSSHAESSAGPETAAVELSAEASESDLAFGDRLSDWAGDGAPNQRSQSDDGDDDRSMEQVSLKGSLRDALMQQLRATSCSARDRALVTVLIEELNSDGYLQLELDEALTLFPAELDIELEELQTALRLLQSFEPTGVGARSVTECLSLQLRERLEQPGAKRDLILVARHLVENHLALLAARDFVRLKRLLQIDDDTLRSVQSLIKSLDPRPGAAYGSDAAGYVTPDVVVRKVRSRWIAMLNNEAMPKLRVNELYAQMLKKNRGNTGGLAGQLQEARWLIKNVAQRFDTILRVSQAIVDRQSAFFTHGAVAMRPLVLREIAEQVELHESTVSRVTTQKYMLTPFGTFELKYFFGSHVATDSGGAASSTAIRELLRQLIESEDSKNPLSDSRLAELLGEQGIQVARRTVAKYREAMHIPAVALRKTL
jgi:RNA polymerase sigma-54 factor